MDSLFINDLYLYKFGYSPVNINKIYNLGSVNEVYKVSSGHICHIIRLREGSSAYREYQKEKFCIEQAKLVGIPTTDVIDVGIYNGVSYMIEIFLNGINGSLCPGKSEHIWTKLGEYTRLFHNIPVNGYGLDMTEYGTFQNLFSPTLQKHIKYNLDCIGSNDPFITLGIYHNQNIELIRHLFSDLLVVDFNIGLLHGDISAKNTIVDNDIVYLIDYGCAFAGIVPYDDIININGNTQDELSVFLCAYGISGEMCCQNSLTYYTLSALNAFDKLRWAIDNDIHDKGEYIAKAKVQAEILFSRTV